MAKSGRPVFKKLSREEIDTILERNNVGRVAFARGGQVEILPVHYVYAKDWIYGRTTPGGSIQRTGERWWPVAFEVDEIDALFEWRSVIVKGGLYTLPPEGAAWQREAWAEGVALLRKLVPETFGEEDPLPERVTVFRIAVQEVTGREAKTE